jgi:hypothetical protein
MFYTTLVGRSFALCAPVAASFNERALGLMHPSARAGALVLPHCRSIHTVGMRYSIDVAFVDAHNQVCKVCHALPPGHIAACLRASYVLERRASPAPWFEVGEQLVTHETGVSPWEKS